MRYTHFEIHNFKGIDNVRLDLSKPPRNRVHALIGLNESGKTTILEALDRFTVRESLDALNLPGYAHGDVHELIPMSKRSNFNDVVQVIVGCAFDPVDQAAIRDALKEQGGIELCGDLPAFTVTQSYKFVDSRIEPKQPTRRWSLVAQGKLRGKRKAQSLTSGESWPLLSRLVAERLPRILYFPNFLFDFPNQIFLEPAEDDALHRFYCGVVQDILDAVGEKTTIAEHILARAKSDSAFDKKALDSVLLKMGGNITKVVFSAWDKVFKRGRGSKEIVVNVGQTEDKRWYMQLRLKEGTEYYEIGERSLGFRWFFTYLLLTQYRGFRSKGPKGVIFLLDEPASNLHSSAQAQLLDSFAAMPEHCVVVYTTHSHHMIKPDWLDNAFVVRNDGLHYDAGDDQYTAQKTLVTVMRYREFAVRHPTQTTYFQPALDVLDVRPALLDMVPRVAMLEGKIDFYALRWLRTVEPAAKGCGLVPGAGAGALDTVIQLYTAWGRNFVIMLDDDREGRKQLVRYREKFGRLLDQRTFSLSDVDPAWKGFRVETLFGADDALRIQRACYPDSAAFNKTHFLRGLQELVVAPRDVGVSGGTIANLRQLQSWLSDRLDLLDGQ